MTLRPLAAIALTTALTATGANAQVITQQQSYFFDTNNANDPVALTFDAFDTMGGTRILTRVGLETNSDYSLNIVAENREDYAIAADDWWFDFELFNIVTFNPGQSDETLFYGMGSVGYGPFSADLAASDGVEQEGDDSAFFGFKDTYSGFRDAIPFQHAAFEGQGQLDAQIYPYLGISLPPPPPFFDLWISHANFGTVTLTYEYTTIPAPATLGILGLGGLAAIRRRRN